MNNELLTYIEMTIQGPHTHDHATSYWNDQNQLKKFKNDETIMMICEDKESWFMFYR